MTTLPEVRIGIVGYGMMGRAHSYGYRAAPMFGSLPVRPVLKVISGRNAAAVAAAAAAYGADESMTDWRAMVERDDIDMVDICTPPGTHAEIAEAAAAAGKAVLSEKPLATSYAQARAAWQAVERAGVRHAIGFNYRCLPAVALMRRMIADGTIGDVRLWRATWLSDEFTDPATPFDWRFDRAMGGTTIADLGTTSSTWPSGWSAGSGRSRPSPRRSSGIARPTAAERDPSRSTTRHRRSSSSTEAPGEPSRWRAWRSGDHATSRSR